MREIINNNEFIRYEIDNGAAEFIFSTAKGNMNFNRKLKEGIDNLNLLCDYYNLNDVGYMEQIHSSNVVEYDGSIEKADAIITNRANVGIGVFTADCVPILIYDKDKKVAAAIHSGWEGTSKKIVSNTVKELINKYNSSPSNLIAYIGSHNRACCYEFGSELAEKYFSEYIKKDSSIYTNNKLNLEKCIKIQLLEQGIDDNNIHSLELCTYCNDEYEFYSYRKERDKNYGRMFSFVVIR